MECCHLSILKIILPARFTSSLTLLLLLISVAAQAQNNTIRNGNQHISVNFDSTLNKTERQQTNRWLRRVSDALLSVYGEWPQDRFNINIKRSSDRYSPVPWGQVTRNPTTVLLVINPDFNYEEIVDDWTAFHELSHLLIPYRGYGDTWFSEGLATYYQNIIRARSGLISETKMWNKIISGFERGRRQDQWPDVDLTELSDNSRRYRSYMRVHWSGVHFWLTADIKLRQKTQNKLSLDAVLKRLKDCCWNQKLSAREISARLDQLAGTKLFLPLFNKYRVSYAMPDYQPILFELGLQRSRYNGELVFKSGAPLVDVRKNIYRGVAYDQL